MTSVMSQPGRAPLPSPFYLHSFQVDRNGYHGATWEEQCRTLIRPGVTTRPDIQKLSHSVPLLPKDHTSLDKVVLQGGHLWRNPNWSRDKLHITANGATSLPVGDHSHENQCPWSADWRTVECFNQMLKRMLLKFVSDMGRDWDKWLPFLMFAYREVPQASTGFSPFELLYGWQVQGPLDLLWKSWEDLACGEKEKDIIQYVLEMRDWLKWYQVQVQELEGSPEITEDMAWPTCKTETVTAWAESTTITSNINHQATH